MFVSTAPATDSAYPTNPLLVQAYINYAVSLSVLGEYNDFSAELKYLETQINLTLTNKTTSRTSDPLILSLAIVAFAENGKASIVSRLAPYLQQYQAADGSLSLNSTYSLAGQSLFGSSPRDSITVLTAYAAQAFKAAGLRNNQILADKFLSTRNMGGLFGGNQATIVAASTLITQL